MQEVKKIVVMGPESTGKSTLCKLLAKHYNTVWCPEFAREYLLANGMNYTYPDLLTIAKGQIKLEDEYIEKINNEWLTTNGEEASEWTMDDGQPTAAHHPLLFVDTDMYVMKVWCEYVFNQCHTFILEKIVERKCSLYLMCDIDLPWVKDELREYPDLKSRKELYEIYKDLLINQTVPWVNISGSYEDRLDIAVKAVDALLTS
jgi:nicotinamide riboside kinase